MRTAAFYSYKGGVGRSLFLANLSLFLARFAAEEGPHRRPRPRRPRPPLQVRGARRRRSPHPRRPRRHPPRLPLRRHSPDHAAHPRPVARPGRRLGTLLPRRRRSAHRVLGHARHHRLPRADPRQGQARLAPLSRGAPPHREQLHPDIVLIDARTGVSELGGAAAQVWAQQVFCMALDHKEHLEGSRAVMRSIARRHRKDGDGLIKVIPVLSRMLTTFGSPEEKPRAQGCAPTSTRWAPPSKRRSRSNRTTSSSSTTTTMFTAPGAPSWATHSTGQRDPPGSWRITSTQGCDWSTPRSTQTCQRILALGKTGQEPLIAR